jgi:quercetin dioxygenase-like cupin family protein
MPAIEFRTPEDTPAVALRDRLPEGPVGERIRPEQLDNTTRMYFPGGPDSLQMFEVWVEPNCGPSAHAHQEAEIIYVLEGELHVGRRVLTAGCAVHIPALTLYSFQAGPEGLRFLNFRARANGVFVSKEELLEKRKEAAR